MGRVELGCGLVGLGRPWGTREQVPSETEALLFLESAWDLGIRCFDTAPSYGLSEERLGKFLGRLTTAERQEARVVTKFGEEWDDTEDKPYEDHTFQALKTSFQTSQERLGDISLMLLHKATGGLLCDDEVDHAFRYVQEQGVPEIGASVSAGDSLRRAIVDPRLAVIQLPYNRVSLPLQPFIPLASIAGKDLMINRPFQMGEVAQEQDDKAARLRQAFEFILEQDFDGIILTGTSNPAHLEENIRAFSQATQSVRASSR